VPLEKSYVVKHGPVSFHFCDKAHFELWHSYRFDPRAYNALRAMPTERQAMLNGRCSTEEFLKRLDEDVGPRPSRGSTALRGVPRGAVSVCTHR
jgi:hypothetical protein